MAKKLAKRVSTSDHVVEFVIGFFLVVLGIITLYPFLNVLAVSFNTASDTIKGGITIFPRSFTLDNYTEVLQYDNLPTAFINSVVRTVGGTALNVFATALIAYTLSRKDFIARKFFNMLFVITMYVGGGMIPHYILIRQLGLMNNFLVYIIPGLVGAFYIFIMRSFIESLPFALQESAMLDGASDVKIFVRIILPLITPSLATVALFYAVNHWGDWFTTYLYCQLKPNLSTLQYELKKITEAASAASNIQDDPEALKEMALRGTTPQSIQMAITIVVVAPILCVYPFLQRYFISGMTIGAVKG